MGATTPHVGGECFDQVDSGIADSNGTVYPCSTFAHETNTAYCTSPVSANMLRKHCPVTCKHCTAAPTPAPSPCIEQVGSGINDGSNKEITCATFKLHTEYCVNAAYSAKLKLNCPVTCGHCTPAPPTACLLPQIAIYAPFCAVSPLLLAACMRIMLERIMLERSRYLRNVRDKAQSAIYDCVRGGAVLRRLGSLLG